MEAITKYCANDGSEWSTEAEAMERERLCDAVASALAPLGGRPEGSGFGNGDGYKRHRLEAVKAAKAALIETSRPAIGRWMERQERQFGKNLMDVHPSWFGRILDDASSPLSKAWMRLCCIDSQGREWGQPYFVEHPEEAKNFEIGATDR